MTRSGIVTFSAALVLVVAGCFDNFTNEDGSPAMRNKPVETPKIPEASVAVAARVDQVGRELVGAVPFFPVDPTFHTAAIPEPMVTHPDLNGVLVSEGLVKRCKSDAELAAVLANELGQMAAEKRTADKMKPVGADADRSDSGPTPKAKAVAVELLVAAGYSASDLDAAAPLLKEAAENRKLAAGLGVKPTTPRWSP